MPRKKKMSSTTKTPVRSGKPVHAWVRDPVRDALDAYLAQPEVPILTHAVELALIEFLQRRGFWPWPRPDEDADD